MRVICRTLGCTNDVEVPDDYVPQYCCDGRECGCYGRDLNPILCNTCEKEAFGEQEPEEFDNSYGAQARRMEEEARRDGI